MTSKLQIEGIAVVEGKSRNNVFYSAKELNLFAPTLKNRPMLKDHDAIIDNVVGKITSSESIDNGKKVRYKGWIKDDGNGLLEKIKDGRVSEVSIGASAKRLLKEKEDDDVVYAEGLEALELSLVPVPGVIGTSVGVATEEEYKETEVKEIIKNYELEESAKIAIQENKEIDNIQIKCKQEEKNNMESNTESKVVENTVVENAEVKALKEKLAESEKIIAAMKEVQRQEAVKAYKCAVAEKSLAEIDVSNASMETITALTEMAKSVKMVKEEAEEPKAEEPKAEEPKAEEPKAEEPKVDEKKEIAMPKTQEVTESKIVGEFANYVIEQSELGGWSFYRN